VPKEKIQIALFILAGVYTFGALGTIYFQASNVAQRIYDQTNEDVFFKSINNPFWRWSPKIRQVLNSDSSFKAYVNRVETTKYLLYLIWAFIFGINVFVAWFL